MRVERGSVFGDDGWELRVTGRCLREDIGLHAGAWAHEHASTRLGALLAGLEASRATFGESGSIATIGDETTAMGIWSDGADLLWVLTVGTREEIETRLGEVSELMPTAEDRRRHHVNRLAAWIEDVRVVAPLLHLRARESHGEHCSVALPRGGELAIEQSGEELFVDVRVGIECSPRERARLAATAVAAVKPVPGWRPVEQSGSDPGDAGHLVYRLSCE